MLRLLAFCAAAPLFAQSGMEAIFAPLDIKGPGAAVLVLKNGKPIFERGYGVRDLRGNAKITSGTNFRSDYNLDGAINSADASICRSRSGQFIP